MQLSLKGDKNYCPTRTNLVPLELTRAVEGLDSPIRWKIVDLLMQNARLSYTQIQQSLEVSNADLNYHLQKLLRGALVQQFAIEGSVERYSSYYQISPFGRQLLQTLLVSLVPKVFRVQQIWHNEPAPRYLVQTSLIVS